MRTPRVPLPAFVVLGVLIPLASASAQVRGGVERSSKENTFSSSGPMWSASQPRDFSGGFDLFYDTGKQEGTVGWFEDTDVGDFGLRLGGSVRGAIGLSASVNFTAGTVSVDYPARFTVTFPEKNSFRAGEWVTVQTAWESIAEGADLRSIEPEASVDLTSRIGLGGGFSGKVCFFSCAEIDDELEFSYPSGFLDAADAKAASQEIRLFQISTADGTGILSSPVTPSAPPLPVVLEPFSLFALTTGVSGTIDRPHLTIPCSSSIPDALCDETVAMTAGGLEGSVTHSFVSVTFDVDTWWSEAMDLLTGCPVQPTCFPLGVAAPVDEEPFKTLLPDGTVAEGDLVDYDFPFDLKATQSFKLSPAPLVTMLLPTSLDFRVTDGATQVSAGTSTTVMFRVGQTLHLKFPDNTNPLGVVPQYDLESSLSNTVGLTFEGSFEWKALTGRFYSDFSSVPDPFDWIPGDGIIDDESSIASLAEPLFSESWTLPTLVQTDWGSFPKATGDRFFLDPESPRIATRTDIVSGLASGTGPAGTLVQTIVVENEGDVELRTTQVLDALSRLFPSLPGFSVESTMATGPLTASSAFDGVAVKTTLVGQDVLPVGGSAAVTVQSRVAAGNVYQADVTAQAKSPIGTDVDATADASFAVFPLVFDVDVLNGPGGRNARVPVHFLNTELLDVHDIDPESVRLDGLAPLTWAFVPRDDVGPEIDLAMQFDRGDVWDNIQDRLLSATLDLSVIGPLELTSVADELLSGTGQATTLEYADGVGNGNGRLDVGDLRALITARETAEASFSVVQAAPEETIVTLPFVGSMIDGTPLVGEDSFIIRTR